MNTWLDLLELLLCPDNFLTTVAVFLAVTSLVPQPQRSRRMKINIHDFESAIAQRFPKLDRNGDGKIDIAEARDAVAQIRNDLIAKEQAFTQDVVEHPAASVGKAFAIGAALGFIPGLVIGATWLARLFH